MPFFLPYVYEYVFVFKFSEFSGNLLLLCSNFCPATRQQGHLYYWSREWHWYVWTLFISMTVAALCFFLCCSVVFVWFCFYILFFSLSKFFLFAFVASLRFSCSSLTLLSFSFCFFFPFLSLFDALTLFFLMPFPSALFPLSRRSGRAAAFAMARAGARGLVLTDRDGVALKKVEEEVSALGGETGVTSIVCDVADEENVKSAIAEGSATFGGLLHSAFLNAGVMLPSDGDEREVDEETWDKTFAVNVKGVLYGCRYAISAIKDTIAKGGAVFIE